MLIALDEGKSIGEYARKAGVTPSVMSRHILDLSDSTRRINDRGMELVVTKLNPENRREHVVYLTEKGKGLLSKITRYMEH
jgi:DNA-binding MarR family transcriptional regulator